MYCGTKINWCFYASLDSLETIVSLPHNEIFACPHANEVRNVICAWILFNGAWGLSALREILSWHMRVRFVEVETKGFIGHVKYEILLDCCLKQDWVSICYWDNILTCYLVWNCFFFTWWKFYLWITFSSCHRQLKKVGHGWC